MYFLFLFCISYLSKAGQQRYPEKNGADGESPLSAEAKSIFSLRSANCRCCIRALRALEYAKAY